MGIFDMKCGTCQKSFRTVAARRRHEQDKHGGAVENIVDDEIDDVLEEEVFEGNADNAVQWSRSKNRLNVLMRVDADTDRLYHNDITVAISYLQEMQNRFAQYGGCSLSEHWTGYENMVMVFEYRRAETDAEYERRQKWIIEDQARAAAQRQKDKDRDDRLLQYQALRREFG